MLDENASLDEIRAYFANDRFATDACGCEVLEAAHGYAKCWLDITDRHLNAQGAVMGGAIFTLADFTLAIACNVGENPTVSVQCSIEFMSPVFGDALIATAKEDKSGRTFGFYTVDVTDNTGAHVARMTATCYRRR